MSETNFEDQRRALVAELTSQQTPAEGNDAMEKYAPQRAELRARWSPHSHASHPELLPWDLGLDWPLQEGESESERSDRLGEEAAMHQYGRLDTRYSVSPTRAEAFELMTLMGLDVIPHATVEAAPDDWDEVIVYTSVYGGHVGQDKVRLPLTQARAEWPGALCSRYLAADVASDGHAASVSMSERDFVAGDFLMRARLYGSEWRSNVGSLSISWEAAEPRSRDLRYSNALLGPLFAIDFIWHGGVRYAVDFNICPGATGADMSGLPGGSVMGALQAWSGWKIERSGPTNTRAKIQADHAWTLGDLPEGSLSLITDRLREMGYPQDMASGVTLMSGNDYQYAGTLYQTCHLDLSGRGQDGQGWGENSGHIDVISNAAGTRTGSSMLWLNSPQLWRLLGFQIRGDHHRLTFSRPPQGPRQAWTDAEITANYEWGFCLSLEAAPTNAAQVWVCDGYCCEDEGFSQLRDIGRAVLNGAALHPITHTQLNALPDARPPEDPTDTEEATS